jgi:hypothetical protein
MLFFIFGLVSIFCSVGSIEVMPSDPSYLDVIVTVALFGQGVILCLMGIERIRGTE